MSEQQQRQGSPLTPIFRASFIKIWTPEKVKKVDKGQEKIDDRYSIVAIFHPDVFDTPEFQEMQRLYQECRQKNFPGSGTQGNGVTSPFRRGVQDDGFNGGYNLSKYPEYEGNIIVTLSSVNRQPGVLNMQKVLLNPNEAADRNQLYSGVWCKAGYSVYAWTAEGGKKKGVSIGVNSIMIMKNGEPLVMRSDPYADFAGIPAQQEQDNSHMFPAAAGAKSDPLAGI